MNGTAKKLQRLSLVDNPVCSSPYYRAYLIFNFPSLRFLDFKKIRDEERAQAKETFSGEHGEKLLQEIGKSNFLKISYCCHLCICVVEDRMSTFVIFVHM